MGDNPFGDPYSAVHTNSGTFPDADRHAHSIPHADQHLNADADQHTNANTYSNCDRSAPNPEPETRLLG